MGREQLRQVGAARSKQATHDDKADAQEDHHTRHTVHQQHRSEEAERHSSTTKYQARRTTCR